MATVIQRNSFLPDHPPSSAPTARLRWQLERARERGDRWDDAWARAISASVFGLSRAERQHWVAAFEWAEPWWRSAYSRRPFDSCATPIYDDT